MITKEEVLQFQKKWGDGIINISNKFKHEGDYIGEAKKFISQLYSYDTDVVFFKPTLASDTQFRLNYVSALSYFIGNNSNFVEDSGFAIKGWDKVQWENIGIKIMNDCAICMGNYFFGMEGKNDLKVEFTIILRKENGVLKIILHDSHLPYQK